MERGLRRAIAAAILHGLQQTVVNNGLLSFNGINDCFWLTPCGFRRGRRVEHRRADCLLLHRYIANTENETEYYTMVLLFIGSMMASSSRPICCSVLFWKSGNLLLALIGYYRNPNS